MGKILDSNQVKSDRVEQAQERVKNLIREQGTTPAKIEELQKHCNPENDPDDNVLKMISEWRNEGKEL